MATPAVGAVGEGASATNAITPTVLTTTVNGAWVFGCGEDWQALGNGTSTDVAEAATPTDFSALTVRKAAATALSGTAVTLNFDAAGAGTPMWTWVAAEITPSAGGTLAVDASSPPLASAINDPVTSASFDPPEALLVLCLLADDFGQANPTLTPTSTGLTFTEQVRRSGSEGGGATNGVSVIFTAPVAAGAGARTISVTTSNTNDSLALKVFVVTESSAVNGRRQAARWPGRGPARARFRQRPQSTVFASLVDGVAEIGQGLAGAASHGTAEKIAVVTGACLGGATAYGTAKKVVSDVGAVIAGSIATGTAKRVAPDVGVVIGCAAPRGTAKKVAVDTGRAIAGATTNGIDRKVAVDTGAGVAGTLGTYSSLSLKAVAGIGFIVAATTGTDKKIALPGGAGISVVIVQGTDKKLTLGTGSGIAGFIGTGTDKKTARQWAWATAGIIAHGTDTKVALTVGAGVAGAVGQHSSTANRMVFGIGVAIVTVRCMKLARPTRAGTPADVAVRYRTA